MWVVDTWKTREIGPPVAKLPIDVVLEADRSACTLSVKLGDDDLGIITDTLPERIPLSAMIATAGLTSTVSLTSFECKTMIITIHPPHRSPEGVFCVQCLNMTGAEVLVVDVNEETTIGDVRCKVVEKMDSAVVPVTLDGEVLDDKVNVLASMKI